MQLTTSFVLLALVALRSVGAAPTPFARSSEIIDARNLDLPELQTREFSQVAFHVARDFDDYEYLDARGTPATATPVIPATPATPVKPAVPVNPANGQSNTGAAPVNGKVVPPALSLSGNTVPGSSPLSTPTQAGIKGAPAPLSPLSPATPGALGSGPASALKTPNGLQQQQDPLHPGAHHHRDHPHYGQGLGYGRRHRSDRRLMHELAREHHHDRDALRKLEAENAALKKASAQPETPPHKLSKKEKKALAKKKHDEDKTARKKKRDDEHAARKKKHDDDKAARKAKHEANVKAAKEKREAHKKAKADKKKADKEAKQNKHNKHDAEKKPADKKPADTKPADKKPADKKPATSTTTPSSTSTTTTPPTKPGSSSPSTPVVPAANAKAASKDATTTPPLSPTALKGATPPAGAPKPNVLLAQPGASSTSSTGTGAGALTPPASPLNPAQQDPTHPHHHRFADSMASDRGYGRGRHWNEGQFAASEGALSQRYGRHHFQHRDSY